MYLDGDVSIALWLSQLPSDADRDQALRDYIHHDSVGRAVRARWIDIFTMRMGALEAPASATALATLAETLFSTQGHLDPHWAAEAAFLDWPYDG